MLYDVIIIGGGAAGLFLAANLEHCNALLLEGGKRLGRKLKLSGGGRANLTNTLPLSDLVYGYNDTDFASDIISDFTNVDLIDWFSQRKLETTNEGIYVYPKSFRAADVLSLLANEAKKRLEIKVNSRVIDFEETNEFVRVFTENCEYKTKKLVIAVGGASFPQTGSDGILLKKTFDITPFSHALASVRIKEDIFKGIFGVTVDEVTISTQTKTLSRPLLISENLLSGPLILSLSAYLKPRDCFSLSFLKNSKKEHLKSIMKRIDKSGKKSLKSVVSEDFNIAKSVFDALIKDLDIKDIRAAEAGKKGVVRMLDLLSNVQLSVKSLSDLEKSYCTRGGVKLENVDIKNLRAKEYKNVYVIGEALNIDGFSGGYNLQFAFSSAMRVAKSIEEYIEKS